jgi:hypothetical protein
MVTIHEILHGNGEAFFPIYRRYLEIMQWILHGTRYKEIGEFLTGINFQSYWEYMQNLFAWEMAEYYMQSTHLFDITMLSKELEKWEDGFYDPPLAYLTWLRFYFPSEYQRNSVIK